MTYIYILLIVDQSFHSLIVFTGDPCLWSSFLKLHQHVAGNRLVSYSLGGSYTCFTEVIINPYMDTYREHHAQITSSFAGLLRPVVALPLPSARKFRNPVTAPAPPRSQPLLGNTVRDIETIRTETFPRIRLGLNCFSLHLPKAFYWKSGSLAQLKWASEGRKGRKTFQARNSEILIPPFWTFNSSFSRGLLSVSLYPHYCIKLINLYFNSHCAY